MNTLELFLTHQVYSTAQHPRGWDKHVYDDENIHYYLLKGLMEGSPSFTQTFLELPRAPNQIHCTIKPDKGIFDMLVKADDEKRYIEVKIWAHLSETQLLRQVKFLREKNANGIHLLFTNAAKKWPAQKVTTEFGSSTRVLGTPDLISCLKTATFGGILKELATSYSVALNHLEGRWQSNNIVKRDGPREPAPTR